MSAEDKFIANSPEAQIIHDFIENLRAERRLYPDLYANELADKLREPE